MISYWVYILLCENGAYYTGYTNDLKKRYRSHINGTGRCKYTRSFKPVCIAQCWQVFTDKSFAMKIERQIKKLSRDEKIDLIMNPSQLIIDERIQVISSEALVQAMREDF